MAIEITCSKCGFKSDSPHNFGDKKFGAQVRSNWHRIHLCLTCQGALRATLNRVRSTFLGLEEDMSGWSEEEGVL